MSTKSKIKQFIKILLSFSMLRFKYYKNIYLFFGNKFLSPESLLRHYDKICQNVSFSEMFHLVSIVHDRNPEDLGTTEKYIGLLQADKKYEEAINLARMSCHRRKEALVSTLNPEYELQVKGPQLAPVVQISGYFYSGSGAVLDYLKGYEGSLKWSPGGEVRIVKFPGGLADLYKKLTAGEKITRVEILDLYLHITGCFYDATKRSQYSRKAMVNKDSRKLMANPKASTYVYELLCLWEQLDEFSRYENQSPEKFIQLVKTGLHRAFNAVIFTNKIKILLLDQMVTAWRMPTAILLPPSKFIVVHRDPRDQFVDANNVMGVPGRPKWTTEEYAKIYRKWRSIADEWIPQLTAESGHSFLRMGFENFILNHEADIKKIEEFLDIADYKFSKDLTKFDPKKSIVNVGKYRKYLKKEAQEVFEKQLAEYCIDPLGRR